MHKRRPAGGPALVESQNDESLLAPRYHLSWRSALGFLTVKYGVRTKVRRRNRQQLLLAVDQIAGTERCEFESMSMRNGIGRARFYTIPAKDTSIVVDVINLSVALRSRNTVLCGVLVCLDVNTVRWTRRRTQKTGHAFLQPVLIALQYV